MSICTDTKLGVVVGVGREAGASSLLYRRYLDSVEAQQQLEWINLADSECCGCTKQSFAVIQQS